jgi:hypothetical protein
VSLAYISVLAISILFMGLDMAGYQKPAATGKAIKTCVASAIYLFSTAARIIQRYTYD